MSFTALLEKTAALLEWQADQLDTETQAKTASYYSDVAERLAPAIRAYEQLSGTKLAEEQLTELIENGDSPLLPILEKLASENTTVGMGTPERPVVTRRVEPDSPKPIGMRTKDRTIRRGRRRSFSELKRDQNRY